MPFDYNKLNLSFVVEENESDVGEAGDEVDENFEEAEIFDETATSTVGGCTDVFDDDIGADVTDNEEKVAELPFDLKQLPTYCTLLTKQLNNIFHLHKIILLASTNNFLLCIYCNTSSCL